MSDPCISIIIPVKNSEKVIGKCISSVLDLNYENYEVFIVDDGSLDKTIEMATVYQPKIQLLRNTPRRGPSAARNTAVRRARGEYIAFTDADCTVDKNWLRELLSGFVSQDIVAVGGSQEVPGDETRFGRISALCMKKTGCIADYMRRDSNNLIPVGHNPSCNVMYKKEIFLKEGGFLEGLWPGEDVELDYRLSRKGYKLMFNPHAVVYHYRVSDLRSFLSMMYRYGWSQGFLVRKYGLFRKIHIVPIVLLTALITVVCSLFVKPDVAIVFLIAGFLFLFFYSSWNMKILMLMVSALFNWPRGFIAGLLGCKR